jgi:CheY-like chemotaxis protein
MSKRILIVEDEEKTRLLLADFLKANQFQVSMASDGEEGLGAMRKTKPDLIILDVMMPKVDGYTFIRELKKDPDCRDIPVIVLTGRETMRDLFVAEGVQGYLIKPYEPSELLGMIQKKISL